MLQMLDDGRLTDNKGRLVDFKNTIIIMTSNIGSHLIQDTFDKNKNQIKKEMMETIKEDVFHVLKQQLRPEFLNRIDEILLFQPLGKDEVKEIVKIQLEILKSVVSKQHVSLNFTDDLINYVAELGFNPQFGARPIKRVIQKELMNTLSKEILGGTIGLDYPIICDAYDGNIVFRKQVKKAS
jgi:ATP-dependent Clp protease ATP-binding subunit ClpB